MCRTKPFAEKKGCLHNTCCSNPCLAVQLSQGLPEDTHGPHSLSTLANAEVFYDNDSSTTGVESWPSTISCLMMTVL